LYGCFLEYDRGTMGHRAYRAKLAAYAEYLASGRYIRDYVGYLTILVVAAGNVAEERIAGVARRVNVGLPAILPLLLTASWRIEDRRDPPGLLGPIGRDPPGSFQKRRSWLRTAMGGSDD
jgi:hypothetical protein